MPRPKNVGNLFDAGGDTAVLDAPPATKKVKAKASAPLVAPPGITGLKRVRIVLEENENIPPTGQFISRNGVGVILRAGEAAEVPEWVTWVLQDAVQHVPTIDPNTNQVIGYRKKLRFPFRLARAED